MGGADLDEGRERLDEIAQRAEPHHQDLLGRHRGLRAYSPPRLIRFALQVERCDVTDAT
jgi:hypothetical protein